MERLMALILSMALVGCATNKAYYNPKKTHDEAQKDWNDCRYDAKKYGFVPMWGSTGVGPGVEQAMRENELFKMCMEGKGYYLVDRSDEPRTVTEIK